MVDAWVEYQPDRREHKTSGEHFEPRSLTLIAFPDMPQCLYGQFESYLVQRLRFHSSYVNFIFTLEILFSTLLTYFNALSQ